MSLPKPGGFRFPQQGWLRVDDDVASRWLNQPGVADDVTLDDIAPSGTLLERINQLNDVLANVSRERVRSVVERTVRHDTQLVKALKELCEFRCQFPGCEVRIPKRDGGFYIEVAHIQAVSEGGSSTVGNLLVLCPNHHKEFDYGDLEIVEQTADVICGKLNGKEFEIRLPGADAIAQTRESDQQGEPSA
jgi:predicted restriction endonuclease